MFKNIRTNAVSDSDPTLIDSHEVMSSLKPLGVAYGGGGDGRVGAGPPLAVTGRFRVST